MKNLHGKSRGKAPEKFTGGDHDHILPAAFHENQGRPGRFVIGCHDIFVIHTRWGQAQPLLFGKNIAAHPAHHVRVSSQSPGAPDLNPRRMINVAVKPKRLFIAVSTIGAE